MFQPPSLQNEFSLVFSGDPALALPDDPDNRTAKLRVAQETGVWRELLKPNELPTLFRFRSIHGAPLTWLQAETARKQRNQEEGFELVFRLALRGVDNLANYQPTFVHQDGQRLLDHESLDFIYSLGRNLGMPLLGRSIVLELAAIVLNRAVSGVPPK